MPLSLRGPIKRQPVVSPPAETTPNPHPLANRNQWPWLPTVNNGTLAPHPYCQDCGMVKFVGTSRAMDLGGVENLLGRLHRHLRELGHVSTEAQRRLISLRLRSLDAGDSFSLSRRAQFRLIAQVAATYLGLPLEVAESYLRSC